MGRDVVIAKPKKVVQAYRDYLEKVNLKAIINE